jgi:hypothetical protein
MALGHLGNKNGIVNMQTDRSIEADALRSFYGPAVREMLEAFPWPFAAVEQQLAVVVENYSPERYWAYAYPAGCILIRRLYSSMGYNRNDDVQSRQKYKIVSIPSPTNAGQMVKVILADEANLWVEYTGDDQVVSDFSPGFKNALSYYLAYKIAPQVTGGDPYKLAERSKAEFMAAWSAATAHAANEQVDDPVRLGEFIDSRGGGIPFLGAGGPNTYPSGITIL